MNKIQNNSPDSLCKEIREISVIAGKKILDIYNTDFSITHKGDNSPLTAADMAAHRAICDHLSKITPDIPVLSEESSKISFDIRKEWDQYWLVDPLDGTREFIKRNGEFTVNIALIKNHEPVMGVVHVPVTDITYSAIKGHGAYKHSSNENSEKIFARATDINAITVAGSRSHGNEKQLAFYDKLNNPEVLSIGSSLKFCLIAEGRADVYPRFGPTSEWDTAAAHAIVNEAGGQVVNLNFETLRYNTKPSLLNPEFFVIADKTFDWKQYL